MPIDVLFAHFREMLGRNLPALLVLVICALVTLVQWRRHPPAARWAFVGFVWFIITYLVIIAWSTIGRHIILAGAEDPEAEEQLYAMALSCIEGLGYLLLLGAVNAARTPDRPSHFYDDHTDEDSPPPAS
ncbi:MAG: hypothetical protein EXR98_15625 [Gemmataceae bacterium]|nr:hypothetical protein [Gemmataceae bacterium]